jgi:hypothetical protein
MRLDISMYYSITMAEIDGLAHLLHNDNNLLLGQPGPLGGRLHRILAIHHKMLQVTSG